MVALNAHHGPWIHFTFLREHQIHIEGLRTLNKNLLEIRKSFISDHPLLMHVFIFFSSFTFLLDGKRRRRHEIQKKFFSYRLCPHIALLLSGAKLYARNYKKRKLSKIWFMFDFSCLSFILLRCVFFFIFSSFFWMEDDANDYYMRRWQGERVKFALFSMEDSMRGAQGNDNSFPCGGFNFKNGNYWNRTWLCHFASLYVNICRNVSFGSPLCVHSIIFHISSPVFNFFCEVNAEEVLNNAEQKVS